jgi:hypothetical protein
MHEQASRGDEFPVKLRWDAESRGRWRATGRGFFLSGDSAMARKFMLLGGVMAVMAVPSLALATCLRPAERTAFDVRALQSQLMVVALSCQQQDSYNSFVTRFRSQLGEAHRGVTSYYQRASGRQAQRVMDQYITNLANNQMQVGITQGSHFCQNQMPLFQQAMTATTAAELAAITQRAAIPQPLEGENCPAPPARQQRASATR